MLDKIDMMVEGKIPEEWGRWLPPSHPDIKKAKEAARARGRAKREQTRQQQAEQIELNARIERDNENAEA